MEETSRRGIGGPKTEEGKRKTSMNALKHGLYATTEEGLAKIEELIGCSYSETLDRMRASLRPRDALEEVLVRRIARSAWRTMITESYENETLARCPERIHLGQSYQRVIHTERFIDIHLHRAIAALERRRCREYEKSQNKLNLVPVHEGIHP